MSTEDRVLDYESNPKQKFSLASLARQREYGVLLLLLITIGVTTLINHDFVKIKNISDMLINAAPTIIIACGVTLVVVTGEIDISVGSLMGVCAAVLGLLTSADHLHWPVWISVLIVLGLGGLVGLINGLLVTIGKVPSIIVTLGMLTALRGATQLVLQGEWVQSLPASLQYLGKGAPLGIPVPVITALVITILFIIITLRTPLGRRTYAVGSNPKSAKLAGISETKIKLIAFVITGLLTAVATVVLAPKMTVIDAEGGKGLELLVVTCVVVGGTSISGGKGSIIGTVLGVLLLSIIGTVLIFMKLGEQATYWERAIQGAFILLAVLADHLVVSKKKGHA